ncbi:MAG: exopolyphosphatase [Flavobacteriales bacterium]|nr:exopolyphosphatase [Flavobacteriales bacterium]
MRLAVIDLGTNTFNLLIVDFDQHGKFSTVFNTKMAVKIGEGAMIKNLLQPEPMARGMAALSEYMRIIDQHKCDKTVAFATSAIRSTSNGGEFADNVQKELGLSINVIDGDEEAQLIYEGVDLAVKFEKEPMVIMDIGGGSTEFVIADETGVLWKKSYLLGISRILQMLEPSDPVTPSDIENLNNLLQEQLTELLANCEKFSVKTLIGSSGSFDSFFEMIMAEKGIDRLANSVVSEEFNLDELQTLHQRLITYDYQTRKSIPGLVEMRVDTIHLASYFVQWVLEQCGLERLLLSSYALKEGVLHRALENRV